MYKHFARDVQTVLDTLKKQYNLSLQLDVASEQMSNLGKGFFLFVLLGFFLNFKNLQQIHKLTFRYTDDFFICVNMQPPTFY